MLCIIAVKGRGNVDEREELHKMIDALPEGKLDLVFQVLEEALEPDVVHHSEGTFGFLLGDER